MAQGTAVARPAGSVPRHEHALGDRGLGAAAAWYTQRVLFLDIAIGVALVGFVATLAWARLVELRRARDGESPS